MSRRCVASAPGALEAYTRAPVLDLVAESQAGAEVLQPGQVDLKSGSGKANAPKVQRTGGGHPHPSKRVSTAQSHPEYAQCAGGKSLPNQVITEPDSQPDMWWDRRR